MEKLKVQSLAELVQLADSLGIRGPMAREAIVPAYPRFPQAFFRPGLAV
jgi:hypothetical protein